MPPPELQQQQPTRGLPPITQQSQPTFTQPLPPPPQQQQPQVAPDPNFTPLP